MIETFCCLDLAFFGHLFLVVIGHFTGYLALGGKFLALKEIFEVEKFFVLDR